MWPNFIQLANQIVAFVAFHPLVVLLRSSVMVIRTYLGNFRQFICWHYRCCIWFINFLWACILIVCEIRFIWFMYFWGFITNGCPFHCLPIPVFDFSTLDSISVISLDGTSSLSLTTIMVFMWSRLWSFVSFCIFNCPYTLLVFLLITIVLDGKIHVRANNP